MYGLSEIETELMEFFWETNRPLPFPEVMRYCNEVKGHGWATTTVHTYLTRLIQKGVLTADRTGYKKSYHPRLSKDALAHEYANRFIEKSYEGSVKNLLIALTYQTKLSREEVQDLKDLLDQAITDEKA